MKNGRISSIVAMTAIVMLTLVSCGKQSGNRRPGGHEQGPEKKVYVDNPNWTITYQGREVDTAEGVYVVDPVYVKSSDNLSYFLDLISLDEFKSKYKSDITLYIEGSFKNNFVSKYVVSGDSRTPFDALDPGDGSWVALAYEVDGNKLGTRYSFCQFKTKAIKMREDKSYEISYNGRTTWPEEDGSISIVDRVGVRSYSEYPYYVEVSYPEYIQEVYGGDPVAFFNDVLDNLAAKLGDGEDFSHLLYNGNTDISFDRFRHGEWTAYAFGVDYLGNLTGNWSKVNFNIAEDPASEDFKQWLGTWSIGGKSTDGKTNKFYNINITSAENNQFFSVTDWENIDGFTFETRFDENTGNMVFTSQYLGTDTYKDYISNDNESGSYDIVFIGNVNVGNDIYSIDYLDGDYDIATAQFTDPGKKASVKEEHITIILDNQKYSTTFSSMQFVDWTLDNNIIVYNEVVPALPMSMTKIAGPDGTVTSASSLSRKAPSRRAAESDGVTRIDEGNGARRSVSSGATRQTAMESLSPATKGAATRSAARRSPEGPVARPHGGVRK